MTEHVDERANPLIAEYISPYYVYLLVDPADDEVFYVGKGAGWRFSQHLEDELLGNDAISDEEAGAKAARIRAIRSRGQEPKVEFARIQIPTETEAFLVEAALIDVLHRHGPGTLTNAIRGHNAELGLITLNELQQELLTTPLDTSLAAVLIKLGWWVSVDERELPRTGHGYYPGMSDQELYDATRAWWRLDVTRASRYPYAVAIYQGVTRAIYQIDHAKWRRSAARTRVAFEGTRLVEGEVFEAFVGHRGRRIPAQRPAGGPVFGTGSPIAYWPA